MSRKFTIAQLEKISGIKAHTIRIWEKRYNLLNPKRTPTNIRYYDEQDLKKLLMVVILYKRGMKISEIANLSKDRLQELVLSIKMPVEAQTAQVEQLLLAVTDFNQNYLDELIFREMINLGAEKAFEEILVPFLRKVEVLWLTDILTCLHYNFAHNQVARFLWQNLQFMSHTKGKCHLIFAPQATYTAPYLIYVSYLLGKYGKKYTFIGHTYDILDIVATDKLRNCKLITVYNKVQSEYYEPLFQNEVDVTIFDFAEDLELKDKPNSVKVIKTFKEFREIMELPALD